MLHANFVQNSCIEIIASLYDLSPNSLAVIDTVTDTLERLVASRDLLGFHFPQWGLLGIELHLHDTLLHGLDFAHESEQFLH